MNILFLTHPYPNYVPDLLLHGLREIIGSQVVDYPKKECLYHKDEKDFWPDLYSNTEWFPKDNGDIDREDIDIKLKTDFFDYLICDVRSISSIINILKNLPHTRTRAVIIDGEDSPVNIKPGMFVIFRRETDGTDFSIPLPMALPEKIFKRITSLDKTPKSYSVGFLGSIGNGAEKRNHIVKELTSHYHDTLFRTFPISKPGERPRERESLDSYYKKLQQCHIVLTLQGAGCDTFRFWENAACNAVHISEKMPLFIPNDFNNEQQIFRFSNINELRKIIDLLMDNKEKHKEIISNSQSHLLKHHLTTRRATYFIDKIEKSFS